jgi:hypothetical protein
MLVEGAALKQHCHRKKGLLVRSIKSFAVAFLIVFAGVLGVSRAHAQQVPGPHPAYLHSLTDLRHARGFLNHLGADGRVDRHEQDAIDEIDRAIGEIKKASIDDGKDINDHPPIDAHLKRTDRFHNAERLLHKVHDDLSHAEDVPEARGLRNRALEHVDKAWHQVQDAINAGLM